MVGKGNVSELIGKTINHADGAGTGIVIDGYKVQGHTDITDVYKVMFPSGADCVYVLRTSEKDRFNFS